MFESLTEKLQGIFSSFRSKELTEKNLIDATREIRLILLEADVNYTVASKLIHSIKTRTIGIKRIASLSVEEQFATIVHEELIRIMGETEALIETNSFPSVFMLCGLEGSGKTTTSVKLAAYLIKNNIRKKPLLIAADLLRLAAVEQLELLAKSQSIPVFSERDAKSPIDVVQNGLAYAAQEGFDVVIIDTAGRQHVDTALMDELSQIRHVSRPCEVFLVINATLGQEAVKIAAEFDKVVSVTGHILTMLDSGAKAGSAISILSVTNKPIKFEGTGERIDDFQIFNPVSMADRILGRGDIINLKKQIEAHISEEESANLEKKLDKASFTFEDYLQQMSWIKKMGSLKKIFSMLPGIPSMKNMELPEKEMERIRAIIYSMNLSERKGSEELTPPRRRRIAKGSGTSIEEVNKLIKGFKQIKQFMKQPQSIKKFLQDSNINTSLFPKK
ncbi:MAG: signal recognition particle protein [Chlamydiales bacterium]